MKFTDLPADVKKVTLKAYPYFTHFDISKELGGTEGPLVLRVGAYRGFVNDYLVIVGAGEWFLVNEREAKFLNENERAGITISVSFT